MLSDGRPHTCCESHLVRLDPCLANHLFPAADGAGRRVLCLAEFAGMSRVMVVLILCGVVAQAAPVARRLGVRSVVGVLLDPEFADVVLREGSSERHVFESKLFGAVDNVDRVSFKRDDSTHRKPVARGRKLQQPGVSVTIQYVVHCGESCGDETLQLDASEPEGHSNALSFATALVEAVQNTAAALPGDYSESILHSPETIAASITPPQVVEVLLPGAYEPNIDCLGAWSPCDAACAPSIYTHLTAASGNGIDCVIPDHNVAAVEGVNEVQCMPGDGDCSYDHDCVGSWSSCVDPGAVGVPCEPKIYTVTVPPSGNGAACPFEEGATTNCAPGEGDCPADIDCHGSWSICQDNSPQTGQCPDQHFITQVAVSGMGTPCDNYIIMGSTSIEIDSRQCNPGDGACTDGACNSSPCMNGATCTNTIYSFECSCAEGFAGFDCGSTVDECAEMDECGVCDSNPDNDCVQDCALVWGGDSYQDECNVCNDDESNDCMLDCSGVWGGAAIQDACGECQSGYNYNDGACLDCASVPYGDATTDECGTCDSDLANNCAPDCANVWGGAAALDPCGSCDENPANDCTFDCNSVWGGAAYEDDCGICDDDPGNDC